MTFRTKLLLIFTLTVSAVAGLTAWQAIRYTRQEFARADQQKSDALIAQFQRELAQRGERVSYAVQTIADAESTLRMALDLSRPQSDTSVYAGDARGLATSRQLDFMELAVDDGTVISSSPDTHRVLQKNDWVTKVTEWNQQKAFLERLDLPQGTALTMMAVRAVHVGDKNLYLIGGQRLENDFLRTLAVPAGMRVLLYRNFDSGFVAANLASTEGAVDQAEQFAPVIEPFIGPSAKSNANPAAADAPEQGVAAGTIAWTADPASAETFVALPLTDRTISGRGNELLGVFLAGISNADEAALESEIRSLALPIGGCGMLIALLASLWISARLTRPVERVSAAVREVTSGKWNTRVDSHSRSEGGRLGREFNEMMQRLTQERDRLSQSERVAAWRDLARQLEHELEVPLAPMQAILENLARAREQAPERFDEVFSQALVMLRAEIAALRTFAARCADLAKTPALNLEAVNLNDSVRKTIKAFEARFHAPGRPPVTPELHLDEAMPEIQADSVLIDKAVANLVANCCASMPAGGTLTIRTSQTENGVRLEVSDSGAGLPRETGDSKTPVQRFAARLSGTGLGLATAQSVVSDHGGKITIESATGAGSIFRVELPLEVPASAWIAPGIPASTAKQFHPATQLTPSPTESATTPAKSDALIGA